MDENPKTLVALLRNRVEQSPEAAAFLERDSQGNWSSFSWREFEDRVLRAALFLRSHGVTLGDLVAIVGPNNLAWQVFQHATYRLGAVVIGLDSHETPERNQALLGGLKVKVLVAHSKASYQTLGKIIDMQDASFMRSTSLESIPLPEVKPEQLATVVFTSGTTGRPKAIYYTHAQLLAAVNSIVARLPKVPVAAHTVCWLPLSHLFQRMIDFCAISVQARNYLVTNPMEIGERLSEINPFFFAGVPRFYEKVFGEVHKKIEGVPVGLRGAVQNLLQLGASYRRTERAGGTNSLQMKVVNAIGERLVFSRIRARIFGKAIGFAISGSAPLDLRILEFFHVLGVPILECYGISENAVPLTLNVPGEFKLGTVGKPLPPNHIKLSAAGEILVKSLGVATNIDGQAPRLDAEGYFPTGDLGSMDKEGFVSVLGRVDNQFKLSTGKKIVPEAIERNLRKIPGVLHAIVVGDRRKVPIALLNIEREGSKVEAYNCIASQIERVCSHLDPSFIPADFVVIQDRFGIESGELTPNLKLRRKVILEKYSEEVEKVYRRLESREGRRA